MSKTLLYNHQTTNKMNQDLKSKIAIGMAAIALYLGIVNHNNKSNEIIRETKIEKETDTIRITEKEKEWGTFEKQTGFWRRVFALDSSKSLVYDRNTYFVYKTIQRSKEETILEEIKKELEQNGNKVTIKEDDEKSDVTLSTKYGLKQIVEEAIRESKKYPFIEDSLKQYELTPELKWLPILESGYNNKSRSAARAVGIWQFIPSTAKRFGLKVSKKTDERRDVEKATGAFCKYMIFLNKKFNDEMLAITAYNHGENGIRRKLEEVNGEEIDDIEHLLGFASKNFYASFIAVADVAKNWKKYGLNVEERVYASKEEVKKEKVKPKYLTFLEKEEKIQEEKKRETVYIVKKGDNLTEIAKRYEKSLNSLIECNNLENSKIYPGDSIQIPSE